MLKINIVKKLVNTIALKETNMEKQEIKTPEQYLRDKYKLVDFSNLQINGESWLTLMANYADQQTSQLRQHNTNINEALIVEQEINLQLRQENEELKKLNSTTGEMIIQRDQKIESLQSSLTAWKEQAEGLSVQLSESNKTLKWLHENCDRGEITYTDFFNTPTNSIVNSEELLNQYEEFKTKIEKL
jgi:hypothetical protein